MAKYYCILFDADNTLLNFDAAENKALTETLVNYGIEPDAETVQTYRTINEELWRQLEKGQIRREKLFGERFSRFLKTIDAAGDGVEMNRFYLEQLSTHPDLMNAEVLDVLRELDFITALPAAEVLAAQGTAPADSAAVAQARVLVQGIADLVLVFPDHLELLDYKTDRRKSEADFLAAYRAQLDLYALAVSKRFAPKPVTYKGIYSLELGKLIEVK